MDIIKIKQDASGKDTEKIVAVVLPKEGLITIDDLGYITRLSVPSLKTALRANDVPIIKLSYKWIIDIRDLYNLKKLTIKSTNKQKNDVDIEGNDE